MKQFKVLVALVLALALTMSVCAALAQTVDSGAGGSGSITISNAAKGETYKVYKIFDATVGANGAISYTGTIPSALSEYFTQDSVGVIRAASGKTDQQIAEAVADYVAALTSGEVTSATSTDGTPLTFSNLTYGYYGVTSSQGAVVSVDSNNPDVTIIDKNSVVPTPVKKVNGQDVDDVHIGETVTYTATFGPLANFIGDEQVQSYTISDTLPEFLGSIAITEVKVWNKAPTEAGATATDLSSSYSAFTNKKIVIPWVDNNDPAGSLYANKSYITIKYTAVIQSNPVINSADGKGNINTVTITPNHDKTGDNPFDEHWSDDAEVKTYGAALRKVDGNSNPLTGAKFTIDGYNVEAVAGEAGVYKITGTKTGASAEMETNAQGYLYILGMDDALTVTETVAPAGYNKLTGTVTLQKQLLSHTIWTASGDRYFDAKGNLVSESSTSTTTTAVSKNYTDLNATPLYVVNNSGVELPSTGGIGTTIFYVAGIVLVLGAAAVVIARRKADAE